MTTRSAIRQFSSLVFLTMAFLALLSDQTSHAQQKSRWPGPETPAMVRAHDDEAAAWAASRKGEPRFRAIYRIDSNGMNAALLAAAPGMLINTDPALSPDGAFVAFGAVPAPPIMGNARLFVRTLEGPAKGEIRDFGHGISPSWSSDGKQIAYAANPGNPQGAKSGVWVMNADGSDRRWLAEAFFPRWSPDGRHLSVHLWARGGTLGLIDVKTGQVRDLLARLPWTAHRYGGGNWSHDGKQITFFGHFDNMERLAVLDVDAPADSIRIVGTNNTPGVTFHGPPAWSPDGKQFVFEAEQIADDGSVTSYLCSISADATGDPYLLENAKVGNINRAAAFSADGKWLVFSSER